MTRIKKRLTILAVIFSIATTLSAQSLSGVYVGATGSVPLGDYRSIYSIGAGVQGGINMDLPFLPGLGARAQLNGSYQFPAGSQISMLIDTIWQITVNYEISLDDIGLSSRPGLGYGGMLHISEYDLGSGSTFGVFYDSQVSLTVFTTYALNPDLEIYVNPEFLMVFGADAMNMVIPIGIGVQFNL